jgi:hypothetical protein
MRKTALQLLSNLPQNRFSCIGEAAPPIANEQFDCELVSSK